MSNIFKVKNIYRFGCLIKYKNKEEVAEVLKNVLKQYDNNNKIKIEIDMNTMRM